MARRSTLKDLSEFLEQNPSEIEMDDVKNKEDYLKKSPKAIVDVEEASLTKNRSKSPSPKMGMDEIAKLMHEKAEKEGKSFSELWLQILEEGAKIDPLLQNTNAFRMIRKINSTTFNIAMEGISKFIKKR
jgi:hypothetical protein